MTDAKTGGAHIKVFLCHSSKDEETAAAIHVSLAGRFDVFYDEKSLPPGETFDDRIRAAIEGTDLFVFLASEDALKEGSYTLTELKFAQRKWPNPSKHVLPVLLGDTSAEKLPTYLKAVNALRIQGNIVAEVLDACLQLRPVGRRRIVTLAVGFLLILIIATIIYLSIPNLSPMPEAGERPYAVLSEALSQAGWITDREQFRVIDVSNSAAELQWLGGDEPMIFYLRQDSAGVWMIRPEVPRPKGARENGTNIAELRIKDGFSIRGRLEDGAPLNDLSWANNPNVACWPATENVNFRGHHLFYMLED